MMRLLDDLRQALGVHVLELLEHVLACDLNRPALALAPSQGLLRELEARPVLIHVEARHPRALFNVGIAQAFGVLARREAYSTAPESKLGDPPDDAGSVIHK